MTHASQPQPSARPGGLPRTFPDTTADDIGWEPIDPPEGAAEESDSDDTPPMPRPAVRIDGRRADGKP